MLSTTNPLWTSDTDRLKIRGWKIIFHANGKQNKAGVAIFIWDLKIKKITRDKEGHYIIIKGSIQEENITIVNIYNKGPSSQGYGFSNGHVWMWELDCEESWALKNWCFWTVVLEKTLESPLDCKEIHPVHSKGDQSWVFIGRTEVEAETPILWPPHVKNWLIGKDPDAGRDWGQEEKGMTEDEMVGWHHWLKGQGFEQTQWRIGKPGLLQFMGSLSWVQLNDWTTIRTLRLQGGWEAHLGLCWDVNRIPR